MYILEILSTTVFLRDIRENVALGVEARKGNIYIFFEVSSCFEGYWTCKEPPKLDKYVAKKYTRVRLFSLRHLLEFTVGIEPTVEDIEKQIATRLMFLLKSFHNKREDLD